MPGFFSISDKGIEVKLVITNRYNISDIKQVRLSRNPLAPHVIISLLRSIATIHIYPKDPERVVKLLTEVQRTSSPLS